MFTWKKHLSKPGCRLFRVPNKIDLTRMDPAIQYMIPGAWMCSCRNCIHAVLFYFHPYVGEKVEKVAELPSSCHSLLGQVCFIIQKNDRGVLVRFMAVQVLECLELFNKRLVLIFQHSNSIFQTFHILLFLATTLSRCFPETGKWKALEDAFNM